MCNDSRKNKPPCTSFQREDDSNLSAAESEGMLKFNTASYLAKIILLYILYDGILVMFSFKCLLIVTISPLNSNRTPPKNHQKPSAPKQTKFQSHITLHVLLIIHEAGRYVMKSPFKLKRNKKFRQTCRWVNMAAACHTFSKRFCSEMYSIVRLLWPIDGQRARVFLCRQHPLKLKATGAFIRPWKYYSHPLQHIFFFSHMGKLLIRHCLASLECDHSWVAPLADPDRSQPNWQMLFVICTSD